MNIMFLLFTDNSASQDKQKVMEEKHWKKKKGISLPKDMIFPMPSVSLNTIVMCNCKYSPKHKI